jgi:hypothetical protein
MNSERYLDTRHEFHGRLTEEEIAQTMGPTMTAQRVM